MPQYTYKCLDCNIKFVVNMSIKDYDPNQSCPSCDFSNIQRDYQADNVLVDDGNPRTVGGLADKNARKKGIDV